MLDPPPQAKVDITLTPFLGMPAKSDRFHATLFFIGRLVEEVDLAGVPAVVPEITGHGWITGFADYVVDATDPFPTGFTVGDIWSR
jgi:proline racemase